MSFDSDDDMMENLAPTNLEFWSLEIPAGKLVEAKVKDLPGMVELVHITGCALGENPDKGPHVVKVVPYGLDGKPQREVALGTLASGRTDQFSVDFGVSTTTAFRHSGKSTVFLTGYRTRSFASDFGSDDEDEYDLDSDDDSDSEDEEAPDLVPVDHHQVNGLKLDKKKRGAAAAAESDSGEDESSSDDDEDESSDDDKSEDGGESESDSESEGEDRQGDKYDELLGAKSFGPAAAAGGSSSSDEEGESGEDESSSDDDGDESSDGNPLDIGSDDDVAGIQYEEADGVPGLMDTDSEDEGEEESSDEGESDDDDEDESSEEGGSDDEESEEEQPAAAAAAATRATPGKRPTQPMTPQPHAQQAKRQKTDVPQSAPARPTSAKTAAGSEQQFIQATVAELRKGGPRSIGDLSNKVKKPQEIEGKYKAFLLKHPDIFVVNGDQVSLKA